MIQDREGTLAFQACISGRVQGVGFRYNTQREANKMRLTGWVRNNPDGTVEVYCEGKAEKVREFAKWLGQGPPGASVTNVNLVKKLPQGLYSRFTVEY